MLSISFSYGLYYCKAINTFIIIIICCYIYFWIWHTFWYWLMSYWHNVGYFSFVFYFTNILKLFIMWITLSVPLYRYEIWMLHLQCLSLLPELSLLLRASFVRFLIKYFNTNLLCLRFLVCKWSYHTFEEIRGKRMKVLFYQYWV